MAIVQIKIIKGVNLSGIKWIMYSINKLSILLLKHLFAVLLIAMTPLNVAAQSISEEISLTEEEQSWIAEHPTISAGNITAYAPFDFVSAGDLIQPKQRRKSQGFEVHKYYVIKFK